MYSELELYSHTGPDETQVAAGINAGKSVGSFFQAEVINECYQLGIY